MGQTVTTRERRLAALKNRHAGDRCVLVANGPSLNSMDLSFLKHECCIGLNKIYLGFRKFDFYPKYYVAVNRNVVNQSVNEIKKLNCVKFLSRNAASGLIPEDALTYHIKTEKPTARFSHNIMQGIHEGWKQEQASRDGSSPNC